MSQNQSSHSDGVTGGPPLFEFVDEAHEVTDEERNRPQYGRPVHKPADGQVEPSKPADAPPAPEST